MYYILFSAFQLILILILSSLVFSYRKDKSKLTDLINRLSIVTIIAVAGNIVFVCAYNLHLAEFGFGVFSSGIDAILIMYFEFIALYTGSPIYYSKKRLLLYFPAIIDIIQLYCNAIFHHVFTVTNSYSDISGTNLNKANTGTVFYTIHLVVCYILCIGIFYLLIRKIKNSPKFYRIKYTVILTLFALLLIFDAVCVFMNLAMNVSIVLYVVLAIAIYYFPLKYMPKELLAKMTNLVLKTQEYGLVCYDADNKCMYLSERTRIILDLPEDSNQAEIKFREIMKHAENTEDVLKWTLDIIIREEIRHIEIEMQVLKDDEDIRIGHYYILNDRTERIHEYREQVRQANEASKAKSEYLSVISHDIRTPINAIYGMNEMILRESKDPAILEYAESIRSSSDILLSIINDVLDFSRIEAGKIEIIPQEYSAAEIIQNVINMETIAVKNKNLQFIAEISESIPSKMKGDSVRLIQVLNNLLNNAVKYTNEGSVTLKISDKKQGNKVLLHVEVIDTGIGIKEEDIPRLQVAFERVEEARNHSIQGTGLGLSITSRLLNLMGSSLQVNSTYGTGSKFAFDIVQEIIDETPIGKINGPKEHVPESKQEVPVYREGIRILLVDDNAVNRKVFCALLKKTGLTVDQADSGMQCLKMITEQHYDLIFMDHMMPEMDGLETYRRMRRTESNLSPNSPVIMLTANVVEGAHEMYLSEGFADSMKKPIIPDELDALLVKYLM